MNNFRFLSICGAALVALLCLLVFFFGMSSPEADLVQNTPKQEFESVWKAEHLPELPETVLRNVSPSPAGIKSGMQVRLVSNKAFSETKKFYETEFQDRGWQYKSNSPPNRKHFTKEFQKNDQLIQITAMPNNQDQSKTDIHINYRRLTNKELGIRAQATRRSIESGQRGQIGFQ